MLGGWKGLVELCRASLASFDGLFQHKCEVSVYMCFQLEVSQLEGSLQQPKAQSAMSPYLVPDTQALCQHLALIKQLASSGRFIIIIPRTGMAACPRPFCAGSRPQGPWVVAFPLPALILDFIWNSCNTLFMCCFWGLFYVWPMLGILTEYVRTAERREVLFPLCLSCGSYALDRALWNGEYLMPLD